jgi:hypothetical protein
MTTNSTASAALNIPLLRKRIQTIFRLPTLHGVSAIALALLEDCEDCKTIISIAPEWVPALRQVATDTIKEISSTFSLDAAKLGALNSRVVAAGAGTPSPKLNEVERLQFASFRLRLMLFALATGRTFSLDTFAFLHGISQARHPDLQAILVASFSGNSDCSPAVELSARTTKLMALLQTARKERSYTEAFPTRLLLKNIDIDGRSTTSASNAEVRLRPNRPTLSSSPRPSLETETPRENLVGHKLQRLNFATPKEFSGVGNLWKVNDALELCELFRLLLPKLSEGDEAALAAVLVFFLSVRVDDFANIAMQPSVPSSIWVDLEVGGFFWDLRAIKDRNYAQLPSASSHAPTSFYIPFAEEVVEAMQEKSKAASKNASLLSLFSLSAEELQAQTRRLLWESNVWSHGFASSRLSRSWGRYLLGGCRDEAIASAISIDFTIGTPSQFHYVRLCSERINQTLKAAFIGLGFSGKFKEATRDAHLFSNCQSDLETLWPKVKEILVKVSSRFNPFPKNIGVGKVLELHNEIALAVAALVWITTGTRGVKEWSYQRHSICLEKKTILVADKATTAYHRFREVQLTPLAVDWIHFYLRWLRFVSSRLIQSNPRLASQIASLLSESGTPAAIPFFFLVKKGKARAFGASDVLRRVVL